MEQRPRFTVHSGRGTESGERPLAELMRGLATESMELVRQEAALARTELKRNLREMGRDAGRLAVGGAVAVVGVLTLTACLVVVLGNLLGDRYWLSTLLVGGLLSGVGVWLARRGVRQLSPSRLAPQQALESLRSTEQWARAELAEVRATLAGDGAAAGNGRDGAASEGTGDVGRRLAIHPPDRFAALHAEPRPASQPAPAAGKDDPPAKPPATAPSGVLPFLKHVGKEFMDDDVPGQAAKLAYFAFLAFPPAFLVLFAMTGLIGGQEMGDWIASQLEGAMPDEASSLIHGFVQQVVHDSAPGPLSIGLLLALWAASNVFMALGDALNTAYDLEESRSWVKRRLMAMGVMLVGVLLLLVASGALIAGPHLAEAADLGGVAEVTWNIVHWPLAFLFVAGAFWIVYYVLPNRDQSGYKGEIFQGALIAALLWVLATAGFRLYIANFGSYGETYGFLGAVIVLLLWLYVTGMVVLAGGEFASELEKRAKQA